MSEKTSDDTIAILAEFGHPIDVKLMAQELLARRAADLTESDLRVLNRMREYITEEGCDCGACWTADVPAVFAKLRTGWSPS